MRTILITELPEESPEIQAAIELEQTKLKFPDSQQIIHINGSTLSGLSNNSKEYIETLKKALEDNIGGKLKISIMLGSGRSQCLKPLIQALQESTAHPQDIKVTMVTCNFYQKNDFTPEEDLDIPPSHDEQTNPRSIFEAMQRLRMDHNNIATDFDLKGGRELESGEVVKGQKSLYVNIDDKKLNNVYDTAYQDFHVQQLQSVCKSKDIGLCLKGAVVNINPGIICGKSKKHPLYTNGKLVYGLDLANKYRESASTGYCYRKRKGATITEADKKELDQLATQNLTHISLVNDAYTNNAGRKIKKKIERSKYALYRTHTLQGTQKI